MKNVKTTYRVKLDDNFDKVLWATIDCVNNTIKYVVSMDLFTQNCYDNYFDALEDLMF